MNNLIIVDGFNSDYKITLIEYFRNQGYNVVNGIKPVIDPLDPNAGKSKYFEDIQRFLLEEANIKKTVLVDSYYSECLVWQATNFQASLLSPEDFEAIKELENQIGTEKYISWDANPKTAYEDYKLWTKDVQIVDKAVFNKALQLLSEMSKNNTFVKINKTQVAQLQASAPTPSQKAPIKAEEIKKDDNIVTKNDNDLADLMESKDDNLEIRLEKANIIKDILSRKILKGKGDVYDALENDIREYLKKKLAVMMGDCIENGFTNDEIVILKLYAKKIKEQLKS